MDAPLIYVYDVYRIYNALMNSKELLKALDKDDCVLRGSKGSHHVFNHPRKAGHITVPHPKKDLGTGLIQKLLKQAGIK
jgi:predicted RNA binding protein YcfA (HicA-like mRNA interferase family)